MTLPAYAMNQLSFPEMYERFLVGPLFRPWAEVLIDSAQLALGERVLDVACGTGIVARLAKERVGTTGAVAAVDVSPQMLAVARTVAPEIDWREGDAAALPVHANESFDVVFCQQGLQFFPDRAAAVREMYRVAAPGGRVAIATWEPLERTPFFGEMHRLAEREIGTIDDRRHAFGDPEALRRLLEDAGFAQVHVETTARRLRFADPAMLVRLNSMALVGMSAASPSLGEQERAKKVDAIARASEEVVAQYREGEAVAFDLGANVATARR